MRLNASEVWDALAALAIVAEQVVIHFRWPPVSADAEDEHVLDLAMNGPLPVPAAFLTHALMKGIAAFIGGGRAYGVYCLN
jgi:hypothetical protein